MKDTLIIKLGALGDVVRTTALLNVLDGNITWFTKPNAKPLLENIPVITELTSDIDDISGRHFDAVLSLDDDLDGCSVLKQVTFDRLYGFYESSGKILPMPEAIEWWSMGLNGPEGRDERKQANRKSFQHYLFKNVGRVFNGEEYCLGYAPKEVSGNIIGIETRAGDRWPMKVWPHYAELGKKLAGNGFIVRKLEQKADIREYVADINECKLIVSGDSLAMHLALALKKKVVGIFGPTSPYEIEMYGRGNRVFADMGCIFCFKKSICEKNPNCMQSVLVDGVYDSILGVLRV